jgi:hypothetical protein
MYRNLPSFLTGSTTYRWGQSSPIRLVFWVELGSRPYCCGLRWT